MRTKVCTTCEVEKPETEFWKQKTRTDGLFGECKVCMGDRHRQWSKGNRDRLRERHKGWLVRRRTSDPAWYIWKRSRDRASKTGVEHTISVEDISVPTKCPIFGIELKSGIGKGGRVDKDFSPSLDRIDNQLGYVPGNVVVVSWRANRLKSDGTLDELRRIVEFYERNRESTASGDTACIST